jgi:3-phytase/alkaline phosphatase D
MGFHNRSRGPRRFQSGKDRFISVHDRTDRDIGLRKVSGSSTADDTADRVDNLARTMLGATELAWLEQTLLTARQHGQTWKLVALSSPIDQLGAPSRKEVHP